MDNVDGNDFDGYIKGINELLTTKAKTENQKTFEAMKQSYAAAKVKGTGKVLLGRGWTRRRLCHGAGRPRRLGQDHPGQHRAPLPLDRRTS